MADVKTHDPASLAEKLQEFVGKPYGTGSVGRDPVNVPMIRHLTDALGDRNPVYTDEEFAKTSVHAGIVAPATSLQVWTMAGLPPRSAEPDSADSAQGRLMGLLDGAGFVGVVATNCEQTYHRYLRPGDLLTVSSEVENIAGPKKTGLGEGYFVTTLQTYRDQSGEVVGEMRFRILKFIPRSVGSGNGQSKKADEKPQGAPPRDAAFFWEGVEAEELRIQRCDGCGKLRHPPRPMCPHCRSLDWDYVVSSGRGEVYSFVVHHRPEVPGREHPFTVGLIELEEGTRIVGNVIDYPPADVRIGLGVQVAFLENQRGQKLPQWRVR
ncbi:MAG: bifunctional MaoC family dehydratase N-terminal/OB-fold nucleic acid binding domain-containing protein [Actinomycetota bacterium]